MDGNVSGFGEGIVRYGSQLPGRWRLDNLHNIERYRWLTP